MPGLDYNLFNKTRFHHRHKHLYRITKPNHHFFGPSSKYIIWRITFPGLMILWNIRTTDRKHYSPEEHISQPHHCQDIKSSKLYESNLPGILKDDCFLYQTLINIEYSWIAPHNEVSVLHSCQHICVTVPTNRLDQGPWKHQEECI